MTQTTTGTPLLGRPLWYELLTTDMKAAEAFYRAVVGWTITAFDGAPQPYDMFNRAGDIPVGGVMTIPAGMHFPPHWEMYVGVPRLEDAVAQIERLGGSALGPLVEVPSVGRMRTMKDPGGAIFAIYEPSTPPEQPEAPAEPGDVSWHELLTTDAPAAMKFYTEVFGWRPTEAFDMGPMGMYHMFGRSWPLGGMMTKTPELAQIPNSWAIYFLVSDLDAAVARAKQNGGTLLNGPMEVPGGDRVANLADSQGAAFSLHERKAG